MDGWAFFATFMSKQLDGKLKFYILTSLAFWLSQIIVVNVEKKRSDYALYMAHHVLTVVLFWINYVYGMHDAILVVSNLMEAADVFLCVCLSTSISQLCSASSV